MPLAATSIVPPVMAKVLVPEPSRTPVAQLEMLPEDMVKEPPVMFTPVGLPETAPPAMTAAAPFSTRMALPLVVLPLTWLLSSSPPVMRKLGTSPTGAAWRLTPLLLPETAPPDMARAAVPSV